MLTTVPSFDGPFVDLFEEVELPEKVTISDILGAVRQICVTPFIQQIVIRKGNSIQVSWRGRAGDVLDLGAEVESPESIIRQIDMDSCEYKDWAAERSLGAAALLLESKGLQVSHVLVGLPSLLFTWLGYDPPNEPLVSPSRILGGRIVEVPELDDDVLVMIGSPDSDSSLQNAVAGVKVSMFL